MDKGQAKMKYACEPCTKKEKLETVYCHGCHYTIRQVKDTECELCASGLKMKDRDAALKESTMRIARNILRTLGE